MEGPKKKQRHGCLIKDFRHDGGGRSSTLNASAITLTVTPEWFYHPHSSPLNGFIRGPQYLKNMDASLNFRHDKKRSLGVRGTV